MLWHRGLSPPHCLSNLGLVVLSFWPFGLCEAKFLSFWPFAPRFPFILAFWALISVHFGLLGLAFVVVLAFELSGPCFPFFVLSCSTWTGSKLLSFTRSEEKTTQNQTLCCVQRQGRTCQQRSPFFRTRTCVVPILHFVLRELRLFWIHHKVWQQNPRRHKKTS